jgi:hypothetical protein
MKRKLVYVLLGALLSGCAAYYHDGYYRDGYSRGYYSYGYGYRGHYHDHGQ